MTRPPPKSRWVPHTSFLLGVTALAISLGVGFGAEPSPIAGRTKSTPLLAVVVAAAESDHAPTTRSYDDWVAACQRLPSNRRLRGAPPPASLLPLPRFAEFGNVLSSFVAQSRTGALGRTNLWIGAPPTAHDFFNTDTAYFLAPDAPSSALLENFLAAARGPRTAPTIPFQPFAAKVEVPEDSEIYMHADLHGDLRSLLADLAWLNGNGYLRGFEVVKPGFHMVFFGDYTDRGGYGVEVLYTLLRLRLANPDRVHLARGNHEEVSLAARYGFLSEGRLKYGADFDTLKVLRTYDFLPVVIWLGSGGNYIQCNHGGMEPGFDPRRLLSAAGPTAFQFIGTLTQRHFLTTHPDWFPADDSRSRTEFSRTALDFRLVDPINPVTLGFMWNDFTLASDEPSFSIDLGRAFVYGQSTTRYLLEQTRNGSNSVQAVFRGHQQSSAPNPMMRRLMAGRGVFRHWQKGDSTARFTASIRELEEFLENAPERAIPPGSVWTLNISPDSAYGEANGFDYDAFAILKTARNFADWRVKVINVDVPR